MRGPFTARQTQILGGSPDVFTYAASGDIRRMFQRSVQFGWERVVLASDLNGHRAYWAYLKQLIDSFGGRHVITKKSSLEQYFFNFHLPKKKDTSTYISLTNIWETFAHNEFCQLLQLSGTSIRYDWRNKNIISHSQLTGNVGQTCKHLIVT